MKIMASTPSASLISPRQGPETRRAEVFLKINCGFKAGLVKQICELLVWEAAPRLRHVTVLTRVNTRHGSLVRLAPRQSFFRSLGKEDKM